MSAADWQAQMSRTGQAAWSGGPAPVNANVPWAAEFGAELRALIRRQQDRAPRSIQAHLGPSELGSECDLQVIGKMVAAPRTNHVADLWPSIIGTAVHAWLAVALEDENARIGLQRFLAEIRVAPVPEHPGTADGYDTFTYTTLDWKILGPTSMAKIASPAGPSRRYKVQLLLYFLGLWAAGYRPRRIALVALPRTAPTLDQMYVWGCEPGPAEVALLAEVLRVTAWRRQMAAAILQGTMTLSQIRPTPDNDECFTCPLYRPQAAYDTGPGCPGTALLR